MTGKFPLNLFKRYSALLFSLNVGCVFAALWVDSQFYPFFIIRWIVSLNLFFSGHSHGDIGGRIIYIALALIAALPTFLLYIKLADYKPKAAIILLGMTAIGSAPLCWVFRCMMTEAQWSRWLLAEVLLAIVWTVLVTVRETLSSSFRILVIVLHFGIWTWKYADTDMPILNFSVFFISAVMSALWAFDVQSEKHSTTPAGGRRADTNGSLSII